MNETVISTLVGFAGGALACGGVIFALATVTVEELKRQLVVARKSADDWHTRWTRVNNKLAIVRDATKDMKISIRDKKSGSFKKHVCVYNRLMGILSENGYDF